MNIDASTIGWIVTAVVGWIIFISIIFGAKRGLNKTLFRLVWLLFTVVLVYFITPQVTKFLDTIDISSFGLDINGEVTHLSDVGVNIFKSMIAGNEALLTNETLLELAGNIPFMIINILLFVLLFWLLKWILWPIWAIISSRCFDKEKRALKKEKRKNKNFNSEGYLSLTVKKSKNGVGGAVLGAVIGLLICAVTFMPVVGINDIYKNVAANAYVEKDGEKVSLIDNYIEDENVKSYLSVFEDSYANKIFTYTGVNIVSNAMFSELAVVEANGEKAKFSNEISSIIKVYNQYEKIAGFELTNLTKEKLDIALNSVNEIFSIIRGSNLIYMIGDEILPDLVNDLLSDYVTLIDGAKIDKMIFDSIKNEVQGDFKLKDFQTEIESVFDIVSLLNNYNLLLPIVNAEVSTLDEIISLVSTNIKTSNAFARSLVDDLYAIKFMSGEYANLAESGIEALYNTLGIEFQTQNINDEKLKNDLKTVIYNLIEMLKYYSTSEKFDFKDNTLSMLTKVGETLDIIKNDLLNESNYNSLIEFGKVKINDATSSFADISSITTNISNVTSWNNEFTALATLYRNVMNLLNDEVTFDKTLDENYSFINDFGEGFNSAINGDSQLISNKTIRQAVEILLNKIDTSSFSYILNDIIITDSLSLKNATLNKIYNTSSNSSVIDDWQNEFKYNLNVFRRIYNLVKDGVNVEELSQESNDDLKNVGSAIDLAIDNTTLIVTSENIKAIIDFFLTNKVKLPEAIDDLLSLPFEDKDLSINTVYKKLLTNILKVDSWETELSKAKHIINSSADFSDLEQAGVFLDNISGGKLISKDIITTIVCNFIDNMTFDSSLSSAIDEMKKFVPSILSYKDEFEYVSSLIDVLNADYGGDNEAMCVALGAEFNNICDITYTIGKRSKMLDKSVINKFISCYIDKFVKTSLGDISLEESNPNYPKDKEDLINAIYKIKDNFENVSNYQTELVNIVHLVDMVDGSVTNLEQIGHLFDTLKSSVVITDGVIRDIVVYFIDNNTKTITDTKLLAQIDLIKENIENEEIEIESYESEFGHIASLTDVINASPSDSNFYQNVGQAFNSILNISPNDPDKEASVIITREIINNILKDYFDSFIKDNVGDKTLDPSNANYPDEDTLLLIGILEDIKDNVNEIQDFESELQNIVDLFDAFDESNNYTSAQIGAKFDEINARLSKFIKSENINAIVLYFFDVEAKSYSSSTSEYKDIIKDMRSKIASYRTATYSVYASVFTQLETVMTYFADFAAITQASDFTNPGGIGAKLDVMQSSACERVCYNTIVYNIANIILKNILGENLHATILSDEDIVQTYNFFNYCGDNWIHTYEGDSYYEDLFVALGNKLSLS